MLNKEITIEECTKIGIRKSKNTQLYLSKVWQEIYTDPWFTNYSLTPGHSITHIYNDYGVYSGGIYTIPENTEAALSVNQFINLTAKKILKSIGYIGTAYKTVISMTLRLLAHLIPDNQEELDKLCNLTTALSPKKYIDYNVGVYNELSQDLDKILHSRLEQGIIYGIYENEELIYIGQTIRPFEERVAEHLNGFHSKSKDLFLYSLPVELNNVKFKILFEERYSITQFQLDQIEQLAIGLARPKGNKKYNSQKEIETLFVEQPKKTNRQLQLIDNIISCLEDLSETIQR